MRPERASGESRSKTSGSPLRSSCGVQKHPAVVDNKPGAVALVFDRLSPDARSRAHAAALAYIAQGLAADDYVGVFIIDQTLKVLQKFRMTRSSFARRLMSGKNIVLLCTPTPPAK